MALNKKLIGVFFCIFLIGCSFSFKGNPSYIFGLPSDSQSQNEAFTKRLQKEYPDGTTEESLMKRLKNDGFDFVKEGYANIERGGVFPCIRRWQVVWDKKPNGVIKNLRGTYGTICL